MPQVVFSISAGGKDITSVIAPRLISMTVTDGEGLKSDTLDIVIDDVNGSVAAPRTGAILNPVGGYEGNIRDFGLFSVDSVAYEGWPQKITVSAQSVAAKELAKQRDPRSFSPKEFPTYGDIFRSVAGIIGLPLGISQVIASLPNPFEAQAEEDGLEFLTRIGSKINAAITVKAQRLIVVPKGEGKAVSGQLLGTVPVTRPGNLLRYHVTEKDQPKHSKVQTTYYDREKNVREIVEEETGTDGPIFLMGVPFQEKAEAERAAKSKAKELVRSQADANFTIDGTPSAMAEANAVVSGVRSNVDGTWRIKQAVHHFAGTSAYTTDLQCEVPSP